jgi:hypothetical protein
VVAAYPFVPAVEALGDAVARMKREREEAEARRPAEAEGRDAAPDARQSPSRPEAQVQQEDK